MNEEPIKAYLDFYWWSVDVNGNQYNFLVKAQDVKEAVSLAESEWRHSATQKQKARGIYDIRARHARFGEVA